MQKAKQAILILGAGKVGSLIASLLAEAPEYGVYLADMDVNASAARLSAETTPRVTLTRLDATDGAALKAFVTKHSITALVSSLPYHCNRTVVEVAASQGLHYFDLTEDVDISRYVVELSQGKESAFVPQCGLAPGFISIAAHALIEKFDSVDTVKMRVGALPVNPNNALKYSLTWSTDGLINEYGNLCYGIENGAMTTLLPLEGYETITIDGLLYEAFNTSGGLGTLAHTYSGRVQTMNYKTLRYPGHCEKIRLLMNELKLNRDRDTLKRILENSIPKTKQDVVVIYVSVSGSRHGDYFEENYVKKIYPKTFAGKQWSAIQVTTAAGLCAVLDLVLSTPKKYSGLVKQEDISWDQVLENRYGQYYRG